MEGKHGIFPVCHKCNEGTLLPFSYKEDVFEKWKCSECGYIIEKR
jgi:ribosomal protein S27AE